jgi:hypothetical protein
MLRKSTSNRAEERRSTSRGRRSTSRGRRSTSRGRRSTSRNRTERSHSVKKYINYEILFNNKTYEKDMSVYNLLNRKEHVNLEELDESLCAVKSGSKINSIFKLNDIVSSINDCDFSLLVNKDKKIIAILSIVIYGNMWEINYLCGSYKERGLGGNLLKKLKQVANEYDKPITIYAVGIPSAAKHVYLKSGFNPDLNSDGYQYTVK